MYLQKTEVDFRPAQRRLTAWLEEKGLRLSRTSEWVKWDFNDRPFWSAWVSVRVRGPFFETWGVHIYDDGEIVMVTKLEWVKPKKGE